MICLELVLLEERETAESEGAKSEGAKSELSDDISSLAEKYESGGRGVGFISSGKGDPGGQSYGKLQLSSAYSMGAFLKSPEGKPYAEIF